MAGQGHVTAGTGTFWYCTSRDSILADRPEIKYRLALAPLVADVVIVVSETNDEFQLQPPCRSTDMQLWLMYNITYLQAVAEGWLYAIFSPGCIAQEPHPIDVMYEIKANRI